MNSLSGNSDSFSGCKSNTLHFLFIMFYLHQSFCEIRVISKKKMRQCKVMALYHNFSSSKGNLRGFCSSPFLLALSHPLLFVCPFPPFSSHSTFVQRMQEKRGKKIVAAGMKPLSPALGALSHWSNCIPGWGQPGHQLCAGVQK